MPNEDDIRIVQFNVTYLEELYAKPYEVKMY